MNSRLERDTGKLWIFFIPLPVSQGDTCPPCSHLSGMDIEREHFTS